jgi:hypothetical protein
MREKSIVSLLIVTLLLAACVGPTTTPIPVVTGNPNTLNPESSAPTAYPVPMAETPPANTAYPEPGTPSTGNPTIPASGYEPKPDDDKLTRDQVVLNLESSQIFIDAGDPIQVNAILNGNLSDPCHQLRAVVVPSYSEGMININLYSVVDTSLNCNMVIKPFSATIPLGSYPTGQFTVMVNGERLGGFVAGYEPQPGDARLTRGELTLDMSLSKLYSSDSQPRLVTVILKGELPDPCHQLRILSTPAEPGNTINLDVYSVYNPHTICITVTRPFQVTYSLGSFSSGRYSVYVNGQLLGEFDG